MIGDRGHIDSDQSGQIGDAPFPVREFVNDEEAAGMAERLEYLSPTPILEGRPGRLARRI